MTQAADYIATLVKQLKSIAEPAGTNCPFAYPLAMAKEETQVGSRKD